MHLVLLPGMDGTGTFFSPLLSFLPSTIVPHVISYPTDTPLSYSELTTFIKTQLPREPFVILAESFSGPLGLRISKEQDPLLRGLILCATFAKLPGTLPAALKWLSAHPIWFQIPPPSFVLRSFLAGKDVDTELLQQMRQVASSVSPQVWVKRLQEIFQVDEQEAFHNLTIPTLVLKASQDLLLGLDTFPITSEKRIQIISIDSPHMLLQRKPQEAAQIITSFISGI